MSTTPVAPALNLEELTQRVLAIRRGELPPDAVTTDELRQAVAMQRKAFAVGADAVKAKAEKPKTTKPKKQGAIDFNFDADTASGSLF
jgi:hypothetical protein